MLATLSIACLLTVASASPVTSSLVRRQTPDVSLHNRSLVNANCCADNKDTDYVHITTTPGYNGTIMYVWSNQAGESWTLSRDWWDPTLFHADNENPYFDQGYNHARVETTSQGWASGVYGPGNELFTVSALVDEWHPVFCPSGRVKATCWADSAYQKCSGGEKGQAAYYAVKAKSSLGQESMYYEYLKYPEAC